MSNLQPMSKSEFASQFCPKHWSDSSKLKWFRMEIEKSPALQEALRREGYSPWQKMLTIRQQLVLLEHFGCTP